MTINWTVAHLRLALLVTTSIILSIASGWTTWDGMSNFTREPVLSLMITFGIQSIMLIVAWLIGQSFADRPMPPISPHDSGHAFNLDVVAAGFFFMAIAGLVVGLGLAPTGLNPGGREIVGLAGGLAGGVSVATLLRGSSAGVAAILRTVLHNGLLWVMFLTCMAASVFFSFDSLFSVIFPASERTRAANIRALSETEGVIGHLVELSAQESARRRTLIFSGESWKRYAGMLDRLIEILAMADLERAEKQRADRQAKAETSLALSQKLVGLKLEREHAVGQLDATTTELARERAALVARQLQARNSADVVRQTLELIAANESEARAEELGVSSSAKAGRGPRYRTLATELTRRKVDLELRQRRNSSDIHDAGIVAAAVAKLEQSVILAARIVSMLDGKIVATIAAIDGAAARTAQADGKQVQAAISAAKLQFAQVPSIAQLDAMQASCSNAKNRVGANEPVVAGLLCNPLALRAAVTRYAAVNNGLSEVDRICRSAWGPRGLAPAFDALLAQARKCLQLASLPGELTAPLTMRLDALERNRDDKSHRFVVTLNAFQDGRWLAYLALVLALGIDSLIFVAGLVGATAERSQFSRLPVKAGQTPRWAEAVMRNALRPEPAEVARVALTVIRPRASAGEMDVWSHEVKLNDRWLKTHDDVCRVVNAAASIGAARADQNDPEKFQLRGEVVEFLSASATDKLANVGEQPRADRADLFATLHPEIAVSAQALLLYLVPSGAQGNFSAELRLEDIDDEHRPMAMRFLNAAAAIGGVRRVSTSGAATRLTLRNDICSWLAHSASPGPALRHAVSTVPIEAGQPGTISALMPVQEMAPRTEASMQDEEAAPVALGPSASPRPKNGVIIAPEPASPSSPTLVQPAADRSEFLPFATRIDPAMVASRAPVSRDAEVSTVAFDQLQPAAADDRKNVARPKHLIRVSFGNDTILFD